jgi:uncharacterized membrane protein YkgB
LTKPKPESVARWSLVVVLGWLGATGFTEVGTRAVNGFLTGHALVGGLFEEGGRGVPMLLAGLQLVTAVLLAIGARRKSGLRVGASMAAFVFSVPLTLLFTNPVWIDALGGFPAIGAGQGLIKYLAPVGLALFVLAESTNDQKLTRVALGVTVAGLMLPLVWIGLMKFTEIEAQGIEPLLLSSPFFRWMLSVLELQTASILIGMAELITSVLLAMWWFRPQWARLGGWLAMGTFAGTLSFMVTVPGWHPEIGLPALSGTGVFLIKDVGLLAAAYVVAERRG